jgi:hypothetical protein
VKALGRSWAAPDAAAARPALRFAIGTPSGPSRPTLSLPPYSDGLFPLTGSHRFIFTSTFIFIFTFRQRNQCKRERCRILAQVTFFNEVPCPPALRFTISWRTGG